jgi:uncharacterized protein
MAEIIKGNSERIQSLFDFARRLILGENGKILVEQYQNFTDTVTPEETMQVLDKLLIEGIPHEKVKASVGKIINVFHESLAAFEWEKPSGGHFLNYLMDENREVKKILKEIRVAFKMLFRGGEEEINFSAQQLRSQVRKLNDYELHYIKKENILFPYIEEVFPQYRCLQLMWSFHDDFRRSIKSIETILAPDIPDKELLNSELGRLFFVVIPIIFREEHIIFPVAIKTIPEKGWSEMMEQSYETGWCYIEQPRKPKLMNQTSFNLKGKIDMGTGFMSPEQLILLLNYLPVDITFVDENDEVIYFSGGRHRIFPRHNAIIGRKVQNCHPHESVHIVNEILSAFRNGQKEHADFWIEIKNRFLFIRYFALRNEQGLYKGTIEVSQDVTEIRSLQEERRLLEWNN